MAKFDEEFDAVVNKEGGYVNDPDDNGGETYMGISRKYHPAWDGWKLIDTAKRRYGSSFKNYLKKDILLTAKVKKFYKFNYWDCFELDTIPKQGIAHLMFDTAVNMGKAQAIKIAQQTIGVKVTGKWTNNLRSKLAKL